MSAINFYNELNYFSQHQGILNVHDSFNLNNQDQFYSYAINPFFNQYCYWQNQGVYHNWHNYYPMNLNFMDTMMSSHQIKI